MLCLCSSGSERFWCSIISCEILISFAAVCSKVCEFRTLTNWVNASVTLAFDFALARIWWSIGCSASNYKYKHQSLVTDRSCRYTIVHRPPHLLFDLRDVRLLVACRSCCQPAAFGPTSGRLAVRSTFIPTLHCWHTSDFAYVSISFIQTERRCSTLSGRVTS